MTTEEFSNAFDTLVNAYKHKTEFGDLSSVADVTLDEYEKSIFLTLAQDTIVKSYFTRTLNSGGEGFDDSTRRQMDFSSLVTTATFTTEAVSEDSSFDDNGILIKFEDSDFGTVTVGENEYQKSPLFIINEKVSTDKGNFVVVPINYKEYDRMMSRAYCEPLKRLAWRLFESIGDTLGRKAEIILRTDAGQFKSYKVRYVRRPRPIVLVDLTNTDNNLSIDDVQTITECELNPILHLEILQEAVRMALVANGIETAEMRLARQLANLR